VAELSAAKTALHSAESQEAVQHAPVELDRARTKLKAAEQAMSAEAFDKARLLAVEAQADAELAQAKAGAAEVKHAVVELKSSIRIIREEIERARANR
jgi:chromosome segregation ATPase